jgi:two-component system, NarL family, invasion response regulator UvrY
MKKFFVIDDHAIVRNGVRYMLEEFYRPCSVDEATNEQEVIKKIRSEDYDLVLLDINIPKTNTIDLLKFMLITKPDTKVLIFSMNAEKMHARRYLDAGAMGFLSKDAPIDEIKRAISLVLNNKKYYSQEFIGYLLEEKTGTQCSNPFQKLTEREFAIVTLFLQGKSLTEVSSILNIQRSTTGTHKAKLFEKLKVNNMIELVELAQTYDVR